MTAALAGRWPAGGWQACINIAVVFQAPGGGFNSMTTFLVLYISPMFSTGCD